MLLIGGWMDGYVDPVLRMLERCVNAPRRALIGNWVHDFPDDAYPGPNLDWLHELVRFFDHWLKGVDNGVMDEPGADLLPARLRAARAVPGELAGRLAERAVLPAVPGRRVPRQSLWLAAGRRRRWTDGSARSGPPRVGSRSVPASGDDRHPDRAVVGRGRPAERACPRSPARRRAAPDLHEPAARGAGRDPRLRPGRAGDRGVDAGRDGRRPAGRRRARTGRRPRSRPACST